MEDRPMFVQVASSLGIHGIRHTDYNSTFKKLEKFGLIAGQRPMGGIVYYDRDALGVAQLAAGFLKFGVEARHLRMYKTAAERESAFFEQLVMPMLKQR